VAEVRGFFVAVMSLVCSQSGQFANWSDISQEQTTQVVGQFSRLNTPWSPLAWAGRGLVDIGEGNWLIGSGLIVMIVGMACAIFLIALSTSERLYYTGWANIHITRRKKRPQTATTRQAQKRLLFFNPFKRLLPAPVRGVVAKDFIVLRRDLRNLSQLITPLILGVIYAIMLLRSGGQPPSGAGEAPEWFMEIMKSIVVYGNVGIALFVSWFLISRLAMMGFSQEGKSYWLLKSAPVSTSKLLGAKFLVAYIPALILGWSFLLVISVIQGASLSTLLYSLVVIALIVAGADGLNLAFGVAGANLEWDDPRKMTSGGIGCLGTIVGLIYLVVSLVFFIGPMVIFGLLRWPQFLGQTLGLALGGAFSLITAFLPLWLVRKQVPYIGEVKSK
jgi:ABC-2 type transport system permease protein